MAKRNVFLERSDLEENLIMRGIFSGDGPDEEDLEMLKLAFKKLKEEKNEVVDGISWAYYPSVPPQSSPKPSKRRKIAQHVTGSARTEGYYKIDPMEKGAYLQNNFATTDHDTRQKIEDSSSRSRSNRAAHRRLESSHSTCTDTHKYNQLKARKKELKYSKSKIHGWGLFVMENIMAGEMVIEYVGEVIRSSLADEREKRYEAARIESSYMFKLDEDYVIDATKKGNLARFINHCCDPNCYAKVFQKKIVIYAKRDIKANEEITYDYKFPIEDKKIPCVCGAKNCRGTLN